MQEEGQSSKLFTASTPDEQAQLGNSNQSVTSSSLLQDSSFNSRFDKDLQLGLAVRDQVQAGVPKGNLRAISTVWLNKYLHYIDVLASSETDSARMAVHRPSPIMNFDLLCLEGEYMHQLQSALNYEDPAKWCDMFNNWEFMSLLSDLKQGEHFKLLTQANWTKLKQAFGGGPEIPFFQYLEDVEVELPNGTMETRKESRQDFEPIRVCVHILKRTKESSEKSLTLLVSKHLTHNQFKNYLAQVRTDVGSRVEMFVVHPANDMPIIMEVSKEKRTLAELGVENLTDVVIFDVDITPENTTNKTQLYHIIGERFGIQKLEYEDLLPKLGADIGLDAPIIDFYDSMPAPRQSSNVGQISGSSSSALPQQSQPSFNQQTNNIPPEYQSDPDLWYAIQASLGNESNAVGNNHNVDPIDDMIMMDAGLDIDSHDGALDAHSPMGAAMEVAHNVSMDGGSTPKKNREIGPIFDENEFGPSGQAPQVHQSALLVSQTNNNQQQSQQQVMTSNNRGGQMTRQDHAKLMREQKRAAFDQKRAQAKQKMDPATSTTTSMQSMGFYSSATKDGGMLRGQLGQPFRQFSEVSGHLNKLRTNFDQIMNGQVTISEVYEQALDNEMMMLTSGTGIYTGQKHSQSVAKVIKSASSALGADEIDSECRTEGDDEHSVTAIHEADKQSKQ